MPYNLDGKAKIQFVTSARMPSLIYRACLETDTVSNTVYIQHAVCEALARDLDIPLEELIEELPPPKNAAKVLFDGSRTARPNPHHREDARRFQT